MSTAFRDEEENVAFNGYTSETPGPDSAPIPNKAIGDQYTKEGYALPRAILATEKEAAAA